MPVPLSEKSIFEQLNLHRGALRAGEVDGDEPGTSMRLERRMNAEACLLCPFDLTTCRRAFLDT